MEKLITAEEAQKILEEFDQMVESFIESKNLGKCFGVASVKLIKVEAREEEGKTPGEEDFGLQGGSSFVWQGDELDGALGRNIGRELNEMSAKICMPGLAKVIEALHESLSSNTQEKGAKKS